MRIILSSLSRQALQVVVGRLGGRFLPFDPEPILSFNLAQVAPFVKIRVVFLSPWGLPHTSMAEAHA